MYVYYLCVLIITSCRQFDIALPLTIMYDCIFLISWSRTLTPKYDPYWSLLCISKTARLHARAIYNAQRKANRFCDAFGPPNSFWHDTSWLIDIFWDNHTPSLYLEPLKDCNITGNVCWTETGYKANLTAFVIPDSRVRFGKSRFNRKLCLHTHTYLFRRRRGGEPRWGAGGARLTGRRGEGCPLA